MRVQPASACLVALWGLSTSPAFGGDAVYAVSLSGTEVYAVPFATGVARPVATGFVEATAVAVDPATRALLVTDGSSDDALVVQSVEGAHVHTVGAPEPGMNAVAVEPGGRSVVTTNWLRHAVRRADLATGASVDLVVDRAVTPEGVAVDPETGDLFWGTARGAGIWRADRDGADAAVLVAAPSSASHVRQVVVDRAHGRVCWADAGLGLVGCADLDGTDVRTVAQVPGAWGLAVHGDQLVVSSSHERALTLVDADDGRVTGTVPLPTEAFYLAVGPEPVTVDTAIAADGTVTVQVAGATPHAPVVLGHGRVDGATALGPCADGWPVAVADGHQLAVLTTDALGRAAWTVAAPPRHATWLVAYDRRVCDGSAPVRMAAP